MAELQERMGSREFSEWIAYASLEPFGPQVEQRRHAELRAHLHNITPQKRGAKTLTAEDFLPSEAGGLTATGATTNAAARLRGMRGNG